MTKGLKPHSKWRSPFTVLQNSTFDMTAGSLFTNHGTLAPSNSIGTIMVNGDYVQTSSGRLTIEFAAHGDHDVFAVTGDADLAGTLELAPMADWYSGAWSAATNDVVQAVTQTGGFDSELIPLFTDWQLDPMPIHIAFPQNRHVSAKLRVFIDKVTRARCRAIKCIQAASAAT